MGYKKDNWSEEDVQRARRMHERGKTYAQIAEILGHSKGAVGYHVRQSSSKVDLRKSAENGAFTQKQFLRMDKAFADAIAKVCSDPEPFMAEGQEGNGP